MKEVYTHKGKKRVYIYVPDFLIPIYTEVYWAKAHLKSTVDTYIWRYFDNKH